MIKNEDRRIKVSRGGVSDPPEVNQSDPPPGQFKVTKRPNQDICLCAKNNYEFKELDCVSWPLCASRAKKSVRS